jgi:hypothetical protein
MEPGVTLSRRQILSSLGFGFGIGASLLSGQTKARQTRNLILVTADGLRWEDVFRGADPSLLTKDPGGVENPELTKKQFWRDTPSERRAALMPFLWSVMAREGQLFGNRDKGSDAFVTNGRNFSYPGYSELLAGYADDRIDSNDKKNNPNVTVLEWLHRMEEFRGKVAVFGAWDAFTYIVNAERSGMLVNAGYEPLAWTPRNDRIDLLNRMKSETGIWDVEPMDAPVFHLAMEYLRERKPRVLYVALGETDEWAHSGRYDLYLTAAHRTDRYLSELWSAVQEMPEYKGSTTMIVTVDHGRGAKGESWRSHGQKLPESKYVWLGVLGPDTAARGERSKVAAVTLNQVAGTLAALLGHDFTETNAQAGKPIGDVLGR